MNGTTVQSRLALLWESFWQKPLLQILPPKSVLTEEV